MRIGNTHIGYCLNIYPGETATDIMGHIVRECPKVKAAVCPEADMGVGLWLAAKAATELRQQPDTLRQQLSGQGLYAFTVNAFPFGDFHSRPVKEAVYQPDWATPARRDYTLDVAHILAHILPEGVDGSISTVPVAYGKRLSPQVPANLIAVAEGFEKLEARTGRRIRLALEPEPDCYLECIDDCLAFFDRLKRMNQPLVDRYLGVCLDVCHCALQFEDPVQSLRRLAEADIQVPKIQVSAALGIDHPNRDELTMLKTFDDGIYLHQTRVQIEGGTITRYADLPEAIAARSDGRWRIHFHVPLHFQADHKNLESTTALLDDAFFQQAIESTAHLETETYTYAVLPNKNPDSSDSVSTDLRFVERAVRRAYGDRM